MSLIPFLVVAFGAGSCSLLLRHRPDLSGAIGIAGLALAALAATVVPVLERLGDPFAASAGATGVPAGGAAALLLVGSVSGLLIVLTAAGSGIGMVPRSLPGATLVTLGWVGLALQAGSSSAAILFATAAGVTSLLPLLDPAAVTERGAVATASAFGVTVAAGLVGLGASLARLVPAGTADGSGAGASLAATALLGLGGSVAVRLGVVPLHRPQARLAGLAPAVTAPLVLVLAPAVFALAGLAAVAEGGAPSPGIERGVVVIAALAGVVLATVAALIHEDLEHVLGYAIAADGAVALLAIGLPAPGQPAAWTWLLVMVAARSALAAWIVAVGGDDGGARLGDMVGWARRRPLLGLALGAVAVAAVGWPGSAVWEARATLAGAVGSSLALPVLVLALVPALVHARLVGAGLQRPDPLAHPLPERSATRLRVATVAFVASAVLALATATGIVGMGGR